MQSFQEASDVIIGWYIVTGIQAKKIQFKYALVHKKRELTKTIKPRQLKKEKRHQNAHSQKAAAAVIMIIIIIFIVQGAVQLDAYQVS